MPGQLVIVGKHRIAVEVSSVPLSLTCIFGSPPLGHELVELAGGAGVRQRGVGQRLPRAIIDYRADSTS